MSAGKRLVNVVESGVLRGVDAGRRAAVEAAAVLHELPRAVARVGEHVEAAIAEVERVASERTTDEGDAPDRPSGNDDAPRAR